MYSIQCLRAVAAIIVTYLHSLQTQAQFSHSFQQDFFYWDDFGAFGVDIFFVISGFIICYSAGPSAGRREAFRFLVRRFIRINPVYYIATLVLIAAKLPALLSRRIPPFPGNVILKSIFLLPVVDGNGWIDPILGQAWTLSFEWLFYVFFFLVILTRIRNRELVLIGFSTLLVAAGAASYKIAFFPLHFVTSPLLLEFMLGVGLCWCYRKWTAGKTTAMLLLIVGVGIFLAELFIGHGRISVANGDADTAFAAARFVVWGIPAALIVSGFLFAEKAGVLDPSRYRLLLLLGNASYSIYLTNGFLYGLLAALYLRVGFFLQPDLAILFQAAFAIAGGSLFYFCVEAPLMRRLKKRTAPSSGTPASSPSTYSSPTSRPM